MVQEPDLYCWKEKKTSGPISESDIYHFLAIIYYFGIVVLPSKGDYWSTNEWMPHHSIVHEYEMIRARFRFLWCHFHPSYDEEIIEDQETTLDEEDENAEEEGRVNIGFERVQRDQAGSIEDDYNDEEYKNEDT